MPSPAPPFRPRSPRQHAAFAALLALACMAAGAGLAIQSRAAYSAAQAQLETLRAQRAAARLPADTAPPAAQWWDQLPSAAEPDRLIRQMARTAPGSLIRSLSVKHTDAPDHAPSHLGLIVTLDSDYLAFKAWLGQLLERQPALAVQAMTLQRTPEARVDVQLSLGLYMRSAP